MPLLEDLQGMVNAANAQQMGITPPEPINPLDDVVEAIRSIQLQVEKGEVTDYSDEFKALGNAVASALRTHGNALEKAIKATQITVEAPQVTVEAPQVELEAQINVPQNPRLTVEVVRDRNDYAARLIVRPYEDGDEVLSAPAIEAECE